LSFVPLVLRKKDTRHKHSSFGSLSATMSKRVLTHAARSADPRRETEAGD
jgi:hypothetical protein